MSVAALRCQEAQTAIGGMIIVLSDIGGHPMTAGRVEASAGVTGAAHSTAGH